MRKHYIDIIRLSIPSVVSNITVPLLGIADLTITGHLDNGAYIGAIAVGGMLFNILYWMFAFLRMGTSGITAQGYGEGDEKKIAYTLYRGITIAAIISAAMILLSPAILYAAMYFINPSELISTLLKKYFFICICGAPASLMMFVLNGWFVGMQNTRIPMAIAIIQNIINIVLSIILVFGLGMKMEGIALGTVIAQWIGMASACFMLKRCYGIVLEQRFSWHEVMGGPELRAFFTVNRDIFLRTICMICIHFYFIAAGARGGDTILAVNAVFMQFFTLYSYFIDGVAYAGEALVGKAIGGKSVKEYKDTVRGLFVCSAFLTIAFTIFYSLANGWLTALFTDNAEVLASAGEYQHWTILFPLCGMAAFIWDGVYIGATESRSMLISTLSGTIVFFVLYLSLQQSLHNHALWIAFLCNLLTRGIVLTVTRQRILQHFKKNL